MNMVVTFGEVMMRLTPRDSARLTQAVSDDAHLGGSEYNVEAGVGRLGHSSRFITNGPRAISCRTVLNSLKTHTPRRDV